MTHFREGTVDADCWRGIVEQNEYNLPEALDPDALIVDIGTHVGSFVQACWNRGARNIVSFEADWENYAVAWDNVGNLHLEGVRLLYSAVGRSDEKFEPCVRFGGYVPFFDGRVNTGGGDVFAKAGREVMCTRFDDIRRGRSISLLKIDCEGSEWPILYTSDLSRVQRIVGEYHSIPPEVEQSLCLPNPCTPASLAFFLRRSGFSTVDVQPANELHAQMHNGQRIGLFSASR
ncbi:MAG: FkbM family methyltransferase [Vulcanimicrobiaceae bacterium]